MKPIRLLFLFLCCCALNGQEPAKLPDGSVPLARTNSPGEQHHHLVLENSYVRVYTVIVPARESTLLHRHDEDYFYLAIFAAYLIKSVLEKPEFPPKLKNAHLSFARSGR